jgi:uncharacterized membrane protein
LNLPGRVSFFEKSVRAPSPDYFLRVPFSSAWQPSRALRGSKSYEPISLNQEAGAYRYKGAFMARKRYWTGFTTGALIGAGAATGALLFGKLWGKAGSSRIIRLEKSIQIGRPVEDVFTAWQNLETWPAMSQHLLEVRGNGSRSHWRARLNGRELEWDAEVEQLVPNEAIGWKSTSGPKHTGRVSFAPLGEDTLVHVIMNYVPPFRLLRLLLAPMAGNFEGYLESVLRDFKRALESQGTGSGPSRLPAPTPAGPLRATGTFGKTNPVHAASRSHKTRPSGTSKTADFGTAPEAAH